MESNNSAIKQLIERKTPQWANCFTTELLPTREDGKNFYEIEAVGEKICLRGDTVNSLAAAYGCYLREYCLAAFDRKHNMVVGTENAELPVGKTERVIGARFRTAYDYPMFSYEAVCYDKDRWENEIDFLAMNGVNMPLSVVGTEAVMKHALMEIGFTEPAAIASISGPSFWAWQLLNCYDGYLPHVRNDYLDKRLELGRWIIERETQLGMTPLMQGFSGYVIRTVIKASKGVRLASAGGWHRFAPQYQIAVRDPMFRRLGMAFLKQQRLLLGGSAYFCADPFFGHPPLKSGDAFLAGFATAIYKLYEAFDKNSVWVMHSSSALGGVLKTVPAGKLLVLDAGGDKSDFLGHSYVRVTAANEDGVPSVFGNFGELASSCFEKKENLVGCGVSCGSGDTNKVFFDFAFERLTADKKTDACEWLTENMSRRYGTRDEKIGQAARILCESCFSADSPKREYGSAIATRPTTLLRHTSPGDSGFIPHYDPMQLIEAAHLLLDADGKTDDYKTDLCELLCRGISLTANGFCAKALEGYKKKDVAAFEKYTNLFLSAFEDIDRLASTKREFSLKGRLEDIRALGTEKDEQQNFEINLLSQITLWGPMRDTELYDIAWREWSGLVSTYYLKRWRAFFELLAADFRKLRRFPEKTKVQIEGRDEYLGSDFNRKLALIEKDWVASFNPEEHPYETEKTPDVARELCKKYSVYSSN